eukprot:2993941-Rhodomonas_salina.1
MAGLKALQRSVVEAITRSAAALQMPHYHPQPQLALAGSRRCISSPSWNCKALQFSHSDRCSSDTTSAALLWGNFSGPIIDM